MFHRFQSTVINFWLCFQCDQKRPPFWLFLSPICPFYLLNWFESATSGGAIEVLYLCREWIITLSFEAFSGAFHLRVNIFSDLLLVKPNLRKRSSVLEKINIFWIKTQLGYYLSTAVKSGKNLLFGMHPLENLLQGWSKCRIRVVILTIILTWATIVMVGFVVLSRNQNYKTIFAIIEVP